MLSLQHIGTSNGPGEKHWPLLIQDITNTIKADIQVYLTYLGIWVQVSQSIVTAWRLQNL